MLESPPSLGLGTIFIAPLCGRTSNYQSMGSEFRYGHGKVLGTQPHPTRGPASTHCVLHLIKDMFSIAS